MSYRMLVYMLKMNNSQTCLTAGEEIITYCLALLSRDSRYCAEPLTAAALFTHVQFYRRVYDALRHIRNTVQFNLLSVPVV
jgi:hypothetical protein